MWFISYYYGMLLLHSRQKVLENITCGYGNHLWMYWIYHSWPSATRDKSNTSLVITITTRDIFQYLLPGVEQLLIALFFHFSPPTVEGEINSNHVPHYIITQCSVFYYRKRKWLPLRWTLDVSEKFSLAPIFYAGP